MDLDSPRGVGVNVVRHGEGRSMNTVAPSEEDNIRPAPRRKAKPANARSPKLTVNDLTCNEADVDGLLSAGELT